MKSEVRSRRLAREAAFKAVYAASVGGLAAEQCLSPEVLGCEFAPETLAFVSELVSATVTGVAAWDGCFESLLPKQWPLDRLAVVDRLILRMACCELWGMPDVPPKVTLSEYTALAKSYGTADSGRFVNGVLAEALKSSPKADWTPPEEPVLRPTRRKKKVELPQPSPAGSDSKSARWVIKSDR